MGRQGTLLILKRGGILRTRLVPLLLPVLDLIPKRTLSTSSSSLTRMTSPLFPHSVGDSTTTATLPPLDKST